MTFDSACKFSYEKFQEDNAGIGEIRELDEGWIFYKQTDEMEYGTMPIFVYKEDKHPIQITFDIFLEMADRIASARKIEIPNKYIR